jgi:hypothetical protein
VRRLAQREKAADRVGPFQQWPAALAPVEPRVGGEGEREQALICMIDRVMAERFELLDGDDVIGVHGRGDPLFWLMAAASPLSAAIVNRDCRRKCGSAAAVRVSVRSTGTSDSPQHQVSGTRAMRLTSYRVIALTAAAMSVAAAPVISSSAAAQDGAPPPPPPGNYDRGDYPPPPQGGYNQNDYPPQQAQGNYGQGGDPNSQQGSYDQGDAPPPPDYPPPSGYDGSAPPPPPPGYQPPSGYDPQAMRARDDGYARNAEAWARDNCVKSRGNTAGGAVIGGVIGALIGNGLSGRHNRGGGTFAGAALGAAGGAAIGSTTQGETSPGCPPGFVVRSGAYGYGYDAPGYYYAAPGWYRPWVFAGGVWAYRPYPYHDYYYRRYYGPRRGWGNRGGYGGRDWHRGH